jgi:alpha-tubulin suppressor-like RCC1 family protein
MLLEDVIITDIACGQNHSVAVDSKKRVFTWGFGGCKQNMSV